MPRDGADHHDLRGVCQGNRCGRESAEYIDDLRTPRAFSRPLASRARSRAPSSALGSQRTLRWREMDSNFRFLVARPSNRHGRSDCFLETWSGSVGEPEIRIHLPPARSPLRTGSNKSGAGAADPWGAHRGGVDPTRNRKFESISLQRLCAKMAHSQSKHTILSQTSASLAQLCFDLTERHNTREALSRSRLRR